MRPAIRRTALALSLVILAACGGGPADDDGTAAPAAVDIDDFRFAPETVSVPVGTEVTWTNQDDTAHTVTAGTPDAGDPDRFDLEVAAQGDTVSTTFDEPGEQPYYCELHPFMVGTVDVGG